MVKEFHAIYCVLKKVYLDEPANQALVYSKREFIFDQEVKKDFLKLAYSIFFNGKDSFIDISKNKAGLKFKVFAQEKYQRYVKNELEVLRTCHKKGGRYIPKYIINKSTQYQTLAMDLSYKPFGGHQIRLPHYYRHMFSADVGCAMNE